MVKGSSSSAYFANNSIALISIRKVDKLQNLVTFWPWSLSTYHGVSVQNRYLWKALRHNSFPTFKAKSQASHRQEPVILRITPQAILVPEFPDGWVVKSSGWSWIITVLPITSSMEKRLVRNRERASPLFPNSGGRSPA